MSHRSQQGSDMSELIDTTVRTRHYGIGEYLELLCELSQEYHGKTATTSYRTATHTKATYQAGSSAEAIFEVMPIALLMDSVPTLSPPLSGGGRKKTEREGLKERSAFVDHKVPY
jgi:hypothetical protein